MTRRGRSFLGAVGIASLLVVAPHVHAQAAAAEALFDQGRVSMEQGDYDTACERFRESDRIDPAVGTKFNLADCEEKRGRLATAWELFRAVLADLPQGDERLPIAKDRVRALEPRVPRVVIRLAANAPGDTKVTLAGTTLSGASFGIPLPVDPGEHTFVVSASGRAASEVTIRLEDGEKKTIEVSPGVETLGAAGEGTAGKSPSSGAIAVGDSGASSGGDTKTIGFVIGGIGLAALAGAGVTGAMTLGKKSTNEENCFPEQGFCNQEGKDAASSGKTLGAVTTGLLVVGAAGLGVGAYFILTSSDGDEIATVAPRVGFAGSSVSIVRRW